MYRLVISIIQYYYNMNYGIISTYVCRPICIKFSVVGVKNMNYHAL